MSYVTSAEELAEISSSYNDRRDSKFNQFCEMLVIKANNAAMRGLREVTIKTHYLNLTNYAILNKLDNRFMFEGCNKRFTTNLRGNSTSLTIAW
jgi:hypothetical protein